MRLLIIEYLKRMYRPNYAKSEPPAQTIEFSALRKNATQMVARVEAEGVLLQGQPNAIPVLLAGYALVLQQGHPGEADFGDFVYEQVPKLFQQYQHEKTMNEILAILRHRIKAQEHLTEFLNYFPVTAFALECWARQKTKVWIEQNPANDFLGNEQEVLSDLGCQIRGPLLGVMATAFGVSVKIHYEILTPPFEGWDLLDYEEEYGDSAARNELNIEHRADGYVLGRYLERDCEISVSHPTSKGSECGFLRRSKMIDTETETRSGGEFKSAKKERVGACDKCGPSKKCECNTIKRKGLGPTPKNNQMSNSSSIGFKNDPLNLGLGFLNANNLSKIRQTRPK